MKEKCLGISGILLIFGLALAGCPAKTAQF
jgi:hypothetical protein